MLAVILICGATIPTSCSTEDNPTPVDPDPETPVEPVVYETMKEALEHIPIVEKIKEEETYEYAEKYSLFFRQPEDHYNPSAGTFLQKVILKFVGFDAPTVLVTSGYFVQDSPCELAEMMNANIVAVEYRYFGESKVDDDPQWTNLTLRQQADDLHAIVTALKPVLKGKWVSTGVSKAGTTSIEYRYFYPDDVDGTVAFCAPIMTSDADPRITSYMLTESGTPEVREVMKAQIAHLLKDGKEGLYKDFCKWTKDNGYKAAPSFEQYANAIFIAYHNVFQGLPERSWHIELPAADASDNDLFEHLNMPISAFLEPIASVMLYPYYIQQLKEFGRESIVTPETADWLKGTGYTAEAGISLNLNDADKWISGTFDGTVHKKILEAFLPTTKCPIMFVYSKHDPWTGGRPLGINNPNVQTVINPVGIHDECIKEQRNTYNEATTQAVKAFVDGLK